ncbi:hemolysin family protein [Aeribacillus composti]|uniref:hemolysin family protein n=1 Tax=Aeribacillus TaxID=1055323 RepID=UPI001198E8AC|nr:hemolysin family protein [Aeribacillus composti]MDR9796220.1 hemolysin family protein [Aeribacillus pallidus]MED0717000.1 hemolysin family protein [Aeribacillus composti]MED0745663.1 hemolysin family protein [Aeribacillus composti]TVZ76109.1 CBS domain containing-hemolysin-like protein [Aeribacillus composti]
MEILNLVLVALLIALTAFFVASEFAIVKVRTSRIDQLVMEGNKKAIAAKKVIANLDEYLSACQLGITITALGLGWIGEPTVEHLLHPVFEYFNLPESVTALLSFVVAFSVVTFLHVVVGELAPKTFAIQMAEKITLRFARPLILFDKIMKPFIKTLNGSARLLTGLFGLQPAKEHDIAHSEEELRIILSESYKSGEINQSEYKYVNNIFEFDNRIAKEIMVPRTEIVAFDKDMKLKDCIPIVMEEHYTRYPVFNGDKDNMIGIVNMKEVLADYVKGIDEEKTVSEYVRPVIHVIETIPIHDLLVKMQMERIHMAILIDEYGGTAGLVTVEDILEEIVGEIRDEFDADEVPQIKKINDSKTVVDGKVLIEEVNDIFGLQIKETDVDTIGGWILTQKMDAKVGDEIDFDQYSFKILDMDGFHVKTVEIAERK